MKVEESLNVTFDETPPPPKTSPLEDDELVEEEAIEVSKTKPIGSDLEDISLENNQIINIRESKSHPLENVIGYSTQSRAYWVNNMRTRVIVETIHVNFDELPLMASKHITETVTTSNELDLLFSLMFDELLNGTTPVVSKSSVVHAVDVPKQRQQQSITPSTSTTIAVDTC
ncbi:hypothetical protein Tco_0990151 [Tanacetum coccineum]|uniref:Uncharacterized protein n=1 Tax=Tanacetum coccineum TaxID=301880 RepID=A0ABQ5EW31_9ASTR